MKNGKNPNEVDVDVIHAEKKAPKDYPYWQRILTLMLTCAAVGIDTLFPYFLFVACDSITDKTLEEIGINNEGMHIAFNAFTILLIMMNFISDSTAVNPIESAENALDMLHNSNEPLQDYKRNSVKTLTLFNQMVSLPSFAIGAASDALTIAYLSSRLGVQLSLGIPVILLGVTYYYMFSGHNLRKHAGATIHEITHGFPSIKRIWRAPARFSEANLRILSNIVYRGIAFSYITNQVLETVFKQSGSDPLSLWLIFGVMGITVYVTAQSRSLQVYGRFFKPNYAEVPKDILANIKMSKKGIFIDLITSLARGVPLGVILYRHSPFVHKYLMTLFSIGTGVVVTAHNFYALHQTRKLDIALAKYVGNKAQEIVDLDQQKISFHQKSSTELFDAIAAHYKTNTLENITSIINFGARAARWIAFIGFLTSLQQVFNENGVQLQLDFNDILCLATLWGIPTLAADGEVFQNEFRENWSYYCAKIKIGAPNQQAAKRMLPIRALTAFFTAKSQFKLERLQPVLQELEEHTQEKEKLIQ